MRIRTEQIEALDRAAERRFEDELLEHLRDFAPELHGLHGDDVFRRVIEDGIARAAAYGFTTRGPARFFVECLVAYGDAFDTDVQIPALADAFAALDADVEMESDEQQKRADELFELTEQYRLAAFGDGGVNARAALERFPAFTDRVARFEKATLEREVVSALAEVHPAKVALIGTDALEELLAQAQEDAPGAGLEGAGGAALLCGLMFAFGQGVLGDPLYPWVGGSGEDVQDERKDPVGALRRKTTTYLTAVLGNLSA